MYKYLSMGLQVLPLAPPPPILILLAKYFAIKLLGAGPLSPPIQGDLESSCSPNCGGWGAFEGNFPSSLLRNVVFAIGISIGGFKLRRELSRTGP
jgi:hypothetical protein